MSRLNWRASLGGRLVPSSLNIAEGWAKRNSAAEFRRYLQMAFGSAQEAQTWLDMGKAEGYITAEEHKTWAQEYSLIGIMLHRLWKKWRTFERPTDEAAKSRIAARVAAS